MFLSSLLLPQFCSFSSHTFSPAIILPLRQTNSHQFCLDFIFSSLQSLISLSLSPFSNSDSSKPNQTIQNSFAPLHFAILLPNQTNYSELTCPLNLRGGAKKDFMTKPNQANPNQTKPKQANLNQTKPNLLQLTCPSAFGNQSYLHPCIWQPMHLA